MVGVSEHLDGFVLLSTLQGQIATNDFCVGSGLRLDLGSQAVGQLLRRSDFPSLEQGLRCQYSDRYGLAY